MMVALAAYARKEPGVVVLVNTKSDMRKQALNESRFRVVIEKSIAAGRIELQNRQLNGGAALAAICLVLAVFSAGCATHPGPLPATTAPAAYLSPPNPPAPQAKQANSKPSKVVKASYQGNALAGHPTASGEPYDPNGLTAASPKLPLGSTVKVTNPNTGRSVKVRINDRGPFVPGRSLDLSKHAAQEIGITHKGVAQVKVTPLSSSPSSNNSQARSPAATSTSESVPADTKQAPKSQ